MSNILLPTSTAGSLPKPSWLAEPEKLWSPWKFEGEELLQAKRDALLVSLAEQIAAGIDIVSDGEQTRQHFVTTFIEHLEGVDLASVKSCAFVTVTMPACRAWWGQFPARNRCLWTMPNSCVRIPTNQSNGHYPAR